MAEMTTSRMEAFSDGVIAIIVTIMVLELRAPAQPTIRALWKVAPVFLSYGLSFLLVAIMWVNHHHLIHAVRRVGARLLWANLNLLFWMSLIPFVTDYLGKNPKTQLAVALYALDLSLCAVAFCLLRAELAHQHRDDRELAEYHRTRQWKNLYSAALYALAAPLAYLSIYASFFIFVLIPAIYFVPERRLASQD